MYSVKTKGIPFSILLKVGDGNSDDYIAKVVNRETKKEVLEASVIKEINGNIQVVSTISSKGIYDIHIDSSNEYNINCVCRVVVIDSTIANVQRAVINTNEIIKGLEESLVSTISSKIDEIKIVVDTISNEIDGLQDKVDSDNRIRLDAFKVSIESMLTNDVAKVLMSCWNIDKHLSGEGYANEHGEWIEEEDSIGFKEVLASISNVDQLKTVVQSILEAQSVSFDELKKALSEIEVTANVTSGADDVGTAVRDLLRTVDIRSVDMLTATRTIEVTLDSVNETLKKRFDKVDSKLDGIDDNLVVLNENIQVVTDAVHNTYQATVSTGNEVASAGNTLKEIKGQLDKGLQSPTFEVQIEPIVQVGSVAYMTIMAKEGLNDIQLYIRGVTGAYDVLDTEVNYVGNNTYESIVVFQQTGKYTVKVVSKECKSDSSAVVNVVKEVGSDNQLQVMMSKDNWVPNKKETMLIMAYSDSELDITVREAESVSEFTEIDDIILEYIGNGIHKARLELPEGIYIMQIVDKVYSKETLIRVQSSEVLSSLFTKDTNLKVTGISKRLKKIGL